MRPVETGKSNESTPLVGDRHKSAHHGAREARATHLKKGSRRAAQIVRIDDVDPGIWIAVHRHIRL